MSSYRTVVVVGGGISGTSCISALFLDYDITNPQYDRIVLLSPSKIIKRTKNHVKSGRDLHTFDVFEGDVQNLHDEVPDGLVFEHIEGLMDHLKAEEKKIFYRKPQFDTSSPLDELSFDVLSICIGSKPRNLSDYAKLSSNDKKVEEHLIVIRDLSTVEEFKDKLKSCSKLAIVGNGGISLELASKVKNCNLTWIIRDESIGFSFLDSGAAKFLLDSRSSANSYEAHIKKKLTSFASSNSSDITRCSYYRHYGPALGPDWCQFSELNGSLKTSDNINILYGEEVESISYHKDLDNPLRIITSKGKQVDCDLIISAIGVEPNQLKVEQGNLEYSDLDGGILIDEQMRTSLRKVYAAGDVVSCEKWPSSDLWFQMRLWTQALQMGFYAGRCIAAHAIELDPTIYSNFDCFTHCTSFFGFKIIQLGKFNCQGVKDVDLEVIVRVDPGKDYVKIIVDKNNRIIGAILAGESGLEETIENLINDRMDISDIKYKILDNTVDIDEYFD